MRELGRLGSQGAREQGSTNAGARDRGSEKQGQRGTEGLGTEWAKLGSIERERSIVFGAPSSRVSKLPSGR